MSKLFFNVRKVVSILLIVTLVLSTRGTFVFAEGLSNANANAGEEINEEFEPAEELVDSDEAEKKDDLVDSEKEEASEEETEKEEAEEETEKEETEKEETEKEETEKEETEKEETEKEETEKEETKKDESEKEESEKEESEVAEEEKKQEEKVEEEIATTSEAVKDDDEQKTDEEKADEAKTDDQIVDEDNEATPSEINDEVSLGSKDGLLSDATEGGVVDHGSAWTQVDAAGLKQVLLDGRRKNVYLSEDVTFDSVLSLPSMGEINVCLHGYTITMTDSCRLSGFGLYDLKFINCDSENKSNAYLDFSEKTSKQAPYRDGRIHFQNMNIVSNKPLHLEFVNMTFDNCTFEVETSDDVFVKVKNSNVVISNTDVENKDGGFVIEGSKVVLDTVSMKNNTVDTLVKATNNTELTIKGKSIYEGNKSIYYIKDSKLFVVNGSGQAKDILREKAQEEYTDNIVTKKTTKLLDPDYNHMDIVYKRNTGSYIIGVENAEVEFDGVIVANELTNEYNSGAYVNLGGGKSQLTLLNRAYINQNTKNIVATSNDEFYGSKENDDGTYETLNRDATLSFYPTADGLTLLQNVIKRDENSNILTARDFKTDDEWHFIVEAFFYKACMIQNYTDDTYAREALPYGKDVVYCEIENIGRGEQKGTFIMKPREERTNIIRFHLGEGVQEFVTWKPGEWDITGTVDLEYIPSWKDYSQYSIEFKEKFNEVQPKWIDKTIPNEPYEYTFRGWSTTKDNLIVPMGSRKDVSIGYLEKGVDSILDKFGKYDYFDVLDLYACWWGDLKITYVFKAEERVLDTENPLKIEKWTEKKIIGRSNHPFTLPTYVKGEDYIYDHFTVVGWQKHSYEDENVDYTITWLGPKLAQGDVVTEQNNSWGVDYENKEVRYYALFEGDTYKVNWYLKSEGIKEVKAQFLKDGMTEDGFYQAEVKLGDKYSRINPVIDDSILSKVYTNFTLEPGVEFLGWTKEEIKKPLTDAELYEEVEVGEGTNKSIEKKVKITLVKDYLMGYSTIGDSYYYPVLHYTPDVAEHPGNIAFTQSYIDTQVVLGGVNTVEVDGVMVSRDTYEVTTDLKMNKPLEIIGDVTIDLHGHELYLEGGAYFYGDGNLTFTDCKHDEVKPKDRGSIYNDNGVIYKGSGNLKFNRMTFRGKQAHRFEALDNEVIIDDVELREEEFNQLLGDPYGDRYPRLMQIDNSSVHIMNTTMDNIDGKIVVMNGGHLELTNFTMINCRRPEKHLDELKHLCAIGGSEIIVNTPCWFENNADIFWLEDSYLEIKSEFGKISSLDELDENEVFTGDFDEIKDRAVIFTNNVYEAIIKTQRSDVRLSGIFYKNKTRLPIVTEYNSGKKSVAHFNGYIYVKENTNNVNDYSDMGMLGNIKYIQEENDFINPLSEMDYYTYYWSSHFRCDPYACREYKILENLSVEEFEGLNTNRDEQGRLKTFTLKNSQNGYNGKYYRPIIDGINFNQETGRGYDVVFNYENELSIIDLNFKNEAGLNCIKFKDMDGNIVDNAVIQFDKRTEESKQKFIDWWNSLEFTSTDKRLEFDSMYRQNPVSLSEEHISLDQILRATASMRIVLKTRRAEEYPYDNFFVTYDMNFPVKPDGTDFNGRKDPASLKDLIEPEVRHDNNGGSKYKIDDWYEIKGVRYLDNAENSYPFVFVGWEYVYGGNTYVTKQFNNTDDAQAATEVEQTDGGKTYLFKPGEKYQLGKDFPRYYGTQFALKAKWEPKEVNIVYKLNKYLKYKGIGEDYVQRAKVGEYADILDVRNIEVDNRFVFTGWYMKNPAPIDAQWNTLEGARWMINGMELQDNMIPDGRFASQTIQDFRKLGSKLYIDEYKKDLFGHTNSLYDVTDWQGDYNKDWIIYPIYYPKDDTVKRWVLEETIKYYDAAKKATQSDTYKTIEDSHLGYTSTFYYFYRSNNTLSGKTSIGEDVELAADITIDGDVTLDLHGHRFVVTTGKFIIPEGSSLTINNCKSIGGFAFGENTVSEGDGQIKFENIYIHDIDNTILFNNANVLMSNVKMNDIMVNSGNLFELKNSKVKLERMSFNGLKAGFDLDNSEMKLSGVTVKNSTVDVLFNVRNNSKVDVSKYNNKEKLIYVNSVFANNKNIALVDNSKFMVTGAPDIDKDTQKDIFYVNSERGDVRNPYIMDLDKVDYKDQGAVQREMAKHTQFDWKNVIPLGKSGLTAKNNYYEDRLERVLFKNNKGNYIFGAKNNAEIYFNGMAINNDLTADADGNMGVYLNLGGDNKLVLRNTPYINQNSRNIVVTSRDLITCDTDAPEYQHGRTLSKNATLSFYLTEHTASRVFVGTEESWKVEKGENPFGTDVYLLTGLEGNVSGWNYMQPVCMIEGYRDTLFKFYDKETYAGCDMNIVFREDANDPTIKGFYAEPNDEKSEITVKLHANGGVLFSVDENGNPITGIDEKGKPITFIDEEGKLVYYSTADGKKIDTARYTPGVFEGYTPVTQYEFVYPRFDENDKRYWWLFLNAITPAKIEESEIDKYSAKFLGWSYGPEKDPDAIRYLGAEDILSNNKDDVVVYAMFNTPPIATITYRIEKGGAENLRGIAYEIATESVVTEIVSKFRLEKNGISADIEAPGFDELTIIPINGWKMGAQWIAEDNPSQPKIAPGSGGVRQKQGYSTINKDAHYYIEWIDPNKKPQPARPVYIRPTNSGGSSSSGGSGGSGGGAISGPLPSGAIEAVGPGAALANMILNVQAQAQLQAQQEASQPTNNNPFALATVVNELGQVQVLTAEETGRMQVEKASLAIQAALTNVAGVAAKVSETNLSSNDSSWTKNAEGKWVLNSNTAGQVKDTWQQVTDANGVGSWYKFDANGNMQTGWITDGNKVFYLIESGASEGQMVRGAVIDIGGYQFKFNADGSLDSMGIASINPIV